MTAQPITADAEADIDPRIQWWLKGEAHQNFGDALTPYLATELLTRKPVVEGTLYYLMGSAVEYWVIKSLLEQPTPDGSEAHIVFWGCGLRDVHPPTPEQLAHVTLCGVRGPLSRHYLKLDSDAPIGDPALLLPAVYTPLMDASLADKTICIPHINEPMSDEELRLATNADIVIRPQIGNSKSDLLRMIDIICSAKFVLAGAMHAAIVAAAYGREFAFLDAGHLDIPFKWRDFAASINVPASFVSTVCEGQIVYSEIFRPRLKMPKLLPILNAAPFSPKPEIVGVVTQMDNDTIASE
jgi:hypothetical protein